MKDMAKYFVQSESYCIATVLCWEVSGVKYTVGLIYSVSE